MADTCEFIYSEEEMPRYCAAPMCNNSSLNGDPALHLFKFPLKYPVLLDQWMVNIRRDQFYPNENSYLCSEHFESSDIIHTFGRTTLKENAVPSIFKFSTIPVCYVPGCKSGYVINGKVDSDRHFFPPPKNQEKLESWNKAIQRTDKKLDYNCRICDLHFEEYYIEKYYTLLSNGEIKKHEPGKWTLHPEAIPTIFQYRPEKISSVATKNIIKKSQNLPLVKDQYLPSMEDQCFPPEEELVVEESFDEYAAMTDSINREASALRELLEYRLAAAKAKDVDASLMKLEFGNKRIEWVYRGSSRHSSYSDKSDDKEEIQQKKKIRLIPFNQKSSTVNKFSRLVNWSATYGSDDDYRKICPKKKLYLSSEIYHRPQLAKKHTGGISLNNKNDKKKQMLTFPKAKKKFQKQKTLPYPVITECRPQLAKKQTGGKLSKILSKNTVKVHITEKSENKHLKEKTECKKFSLPSLSDYRQVARKQTGGRVLNKVNEITGVAKKSATLGLLTQMKKTGEDNRICSEGEERIKMIPSNLIQSNKPIHKCGRSCSRIKDDDPVKFRGKNPLQIPRLCGWKRHVEKKVVIYSAPCGRIFRAIDEVSRYLWTVKSKLTIDLFSFDSDVYIANEFTPKQVLAYIPDVTFGKENIPVSCVNSINDEYPPDIGYSTIRYPGKGVKLNLDPEFLCSCDCKDNCQNSKKCQCQQLTVNATEALPSGKIPNAGYKYRRLVEPLITGIYECNSACKCGPSCMNRVAQNGLQVRLQLFHTGRKGWGIRCLDDIPQGMFICTYAGELLTEQGASEDGRQLQDDYLAELDHIEVVERLKEGYESDVIEPEDGLECENESKDIKNIIGNSISIQNGNTSSVESSFDVKLICETLETPLIKIENSQQDTDLSSEDVKPLITEVSSVPALGVHVAESIAEEILTVHSNQNKVSSLDFVGGTGQSITNHTISNHSSVQDSTSIDILVKSPPNLSDSTSLATVENSAADKSTVLLLTNLENDFQNTNENISKPLHPVLCSNAVPGEYTHKETSEDSHAVHLLHSKVTSPVVAEGAEGSFNAEYLDSTKTSDTFIENYANNNAKQFLPNVRVLSEDPVPPLTNVETDSKDITASSLNIQLSDQAHILSPITKSTVQPANSSFIVQLNQVQLPLTNAESCSCDSNLEISTVHSIGPSETTTIFADGCIHHTTTDSFSGVVLNHKPTLLTCVDIDDQNRNDSVTIKSATSSVTGSLMPAKSVIDSKAKETFTIEKNDLDSTDAAIMHVENPCISEESLSIHTSNHDIDCTTKETFIIEKNGLDSTDAEINIENSCTTEESLSIETSSHDPAFLLMNIASNSQNEIENSLVAESMNLILTSSAPVVKSLCDKDDSSICQLSPSQNVSLTNTEASLCVIAEGSSSVQSFTSSVPTSLLVENDDHNLITDPSVIVKVLSANPTTVVLVECDSQLTPENSSAQPISPSLIPLSMLVESALQSENEKPYDIHSPHLAQISSIVPIENSVSETIQSASLQFQSQNPNVSASVNLESIPLLKTENSSLSVESSKQDSDSVMTSVESTFQQTVDSSLNHEHFNSSVQGFSETESSSLNHQSTNSAPVLPEYIENGVQNFTEASSDIEQSNLLVTPQQEVSCENNQGINLEDDNIVCRPVSKAKINRAKKSTTVTTTRFSKRNKKGAASENSSCNHTNNSKRRKKPKEHSHFLSVRRQFNEQYCYLMNAEKCGNIGRYLNHSCNPNCFVQNVFVDTHDLRFPWVAFFAMRHVSAGSELTWDYNYSVGSVPGKILYCYCGSENCRGRLI